MREFWVEVMHDPNNRYLTNKTNSINQAMRSTTAILVGMIYYVQPVVDESKQEELTPGKHILDLKDISLISVNRNNSTNQQSVSVPWLNSQRNNTRSNRTPRGATPRAPKRSRATLAQMNSTSVVSTVMESNPIPVGINHASDDETS